MKTIDVKKKGDGWVGTTGSQTVVTARTKTEAVRKAAVAAKADKQPTSVRIRKVNGQIQQERTYPRSADPRRSRTSRCSW